VPSEVLEPPIAAAEIDPTGLRCWFVRVHLAGGRIRWDVNGFARWDRCLMATIGYILPEMNALARIIRRWIRDIAGMVDGCATARTFRTVHRRIAAFLWLACLCE
jgi:hypothetical protein